MSDVRRGLRDRLARTFRGNLTTAGQKLNTFEANVPVEATLETVLSGSYWWPHERVIRPFDQIQCTWEDGSRIAVIRCMGKDDDAETLLWTEVSVVEFPTPDAPAGYRYEFVNEAIGWRVINAERNSPVRSHFATALDAHTWLRRDTAVAAEEAAPAGEKRGKPAEPGKRAKPAADQSDAA